MATDLDKYLKYLKDEEKRLHKVIIEDGGGTFYPISRYEPAYRGEKLNTAENRRVVPLSSRERRETGKAYRELNENEKDLLQIRDEIATLSTERRERGDDPDTGSSCARCKQGLCTCIHQITISPEGLPDIEWFQQGSFDKNRMLLLDEGEGASVKLHLKSKNPSGTCSQGLGDVCPQFFISNVMKQENAWEEYEELKIDDAEQIYKLHYQRKEYKEILKGRDIVYEGQKLASLPDAAKAVFLGVVPDYLYPQTYQVTAIECMSLGSMPEKELTPKLSDIRPVGRRFFSVEPVRYDYLYGRDSDENDRRYHPQIRFTTYIDLIPMYKAHMKLGLQSRYSIGEKYKSLTKAQRKDYDLNERTRKHNSDKLPVLKEELSLVGELWEEIVGEKYSWDSLKKKGVTRKDEKVVLSERDKVRTHTTRTGLKRDQGAKDGLHSIPIFKGLQKFINITQKIAGNKYLKDYMAVRFIYPQGSIKGDAYFRKSEHDVYLHRKFSINTDPLIGLELSFGLLKVAVEAVVPLGGGKLLTKAFFGKGVVTDRDVDAKIEEFRNSTSDQASGFIMGYLNFVVDLRIGGAIGLETSVESKEHELKMKGELSGTVGVGLKARLAVGIHILKVRGVMDIQGAIIGSLTFKAKYHDEHLEGLIYHSGIQIQFNATFEGGFRNNKSQNTKPPAYTINPKPFTLVKPLTEDNTNLRTRFF